MHRADILKVAHDATCKDRNKQYGEPASNMLACARLQEAFWSIWNAQDKAAPQPAFKQAINHVLNKLVRIAHGNEYHMDNYVDGCAYLAIAAECLPETADPSHLEAAPAAGGSR